MLIALSIGALAMLNAAAISRGLEALPGDIDAFTIAAGLGIDEVSVSGHRFTADSDIFDSLDLPNVRTMAALDSRRVQSRIERLPWVATATLTRVYPGRVDVVVIERTPFAVWLQSSTGGAAAILVDDTGRRLSAVPATHLPLLPRLSGDGAPEAAPALFAMLTHYPEIGARLKLASRVTGRRWSLTLSQGLRLELPSEGEAVALEALTTGAAGRSLLEGRDTIIDLRSRREIAARPAGAS